MSMDQEPKETQQVEVTPVEDEPITEVNPPVSTTSPAAVPPPQQVRTDTFAAPPTGGYPPAQNPGQNSGYGAPPIGQMGNMSPAADAEQNKVMGILAYILFLVPMLAAPQSPFAKYHANQGLVLFLFCLIMSVIMIIPFVGWLVGMVGWLASVVFMIMGIINAANGQMKPLPLIGNYTILK